MTLNVVYFISKFPRFSFFRFLFPKQFFLQILYNHKLFKFVDNW